MSPFERDAALISEGMCPKGHGALRRRGEFGACAVCRRGYRLLRATHDKQCVIEEVFVPDVCKTENLDD
jgi:hypothetical protein